MEACKKELDTAVNRRIIRREEMIPEGMVMAATTCELSRMKGKE